MQMNTRFRKTVKIVAGITLFFLSTLACAYLIYPQILPSFIVKTLKGAEVERITVQNQQDLSPSDLQKSRLIAQHFLNPNSFCEVYDLAGPDFDLGATGQQDSFYVRIVGRILSVYEVDGLLSRDWNKSYVFKILTDDQETLIVYRGSIDHIISTADYVQVEGVYLINQGIHANIILPVGPVMGSYRQQQLIFFGWLVLGSLILVLFLLFEGKKKHIIVSILLLLFVLSGCELRIETVVKQDHSGTISLSIRESTENFDFAREVPGMADYFESFWAQLRDQGMLVEMMKSDQQEEIFIQNEFGGFQQLMSQSVQADQSDTWIYVQEFQTDHFSVIRYFANIDTSSMISENLEVDASISSQIDTLLKEIDFSYSVIMPTTLTYHNGEQKNPYKAEWQLQMNDVNQIVVETVTFKGSQLYQNDSNHLLSGFLFSMVPVSQILGKWFLQHGSTGEL